jgi:tetratricopeptide (TPR) repeat protein
MTAEPKSNRVHGAAQMAKPQKAETGPLPDLAAARDLHRQGRLNEAEHIYAAIVAREPDHAEALHGLGLIRIGQARQREAHQLLTAALASYDKTLEQGGDQAKIFVKRGHALHALQRYFEALVSYDRALALKPNWAQAHEMRGIALFYLNRYRASLASFEKALALRPRLVEAHVYRGRALHKLNRYEDALAAFDQALAVQPDQAVVHNFRGDTLACLTRYDEAAAQYDIAIKLDAKFVQPRWSAAVTRLVRGDFQRGWREYECRWKNAGVQVRDFSAPLWLGEQPIAGKTILLHAEQGFGDTIQFVRYAPLVAELGAKVILEVQAELHSLLLRMEGMSAVLAQPKEQTVDSRIDGAPVPLASERELPPFDCHCPLLSLPLAFKTELSAVPARIPYLYADPERVKRWKARLPREHSPLVGLAWSGNPFHWEDRNRSVALNRLVPLLSEPVGFVSLQKTAAAQDAKLLGGLANVTHFGDELVDFNDTAAVIEGLDLIVTVDTAVAHLAAAMGKPVWILLAYAPEWRWLLDREDSPWYPTVRLFRQPRLEDWESVIARVRMELEVWQHQQ